MAEAEAVALDVVIAPFTAALVVVVDDAMGMATVAVL